MQKIPSALPEALAPDWPLSTAEGLRAQFDSMSAHPSFHDLARIFDLTLDLLCVAGLDGYFKHVNPAWTRALGWTLEELKSRPFVDFVHPDDRVSTEAELQKLAQGMTTILFENRYRHRDGGYRRLQWYASPGPRSGFVCATARDVTRQHLLECDIIDIADREKQHLGRELHDSVCQTIAGISALGTTLARQLRESGDNACSDSAEEITRLLRESLAQLRDLSHSLAPPVEGHSELRDLLRVLALQFERIFGVMCTVARADPTPSLPAEVKVQLLRIAQEALSNAVTHGHADRIEIDLRRTGGGCQMKVLDNGSGIGNPVSGYDEGIGLRSMAYRARLIGGHLTVRRRRRKGTAVICVFPMPADSADSESKGDGRE